MIHATLNIEIFFPAILFFSSSPFKLQWDLIPTTDPFLNPSLFLSSWQLSCDNGFSFFLLLFALSSFSTKFSSLCVQNIRHNSRSFIQNPKCTGEWEANRPQKSSYFFQTDTSPYIIKLFHMMWWFPGIIWPGSLPDFQYWSTQLSPLTRRWRSCILTTCQLFCHDGEQEMLEAMLTTVNDSFLYFAIFMDQIPNILSMLVTFIYSLQR